MFLRVLAINLSALSLLTTPSNKPSAPAASRVLLLWPLNIEHYIVA